MATVDPNGRVEVGILEGEAAAYRFPELRGRPNVAFALEVTGSPGGFVVVQDMFDSEVFGRRIGRILDVELPSTALRAGLLAALPPLAAGRGFDQLLRRAAVTEPAEHWALSRAGFELMDVGVMFTRPLDGVGPPPARPDIVVRPATDDDMSAIASGMLELPWGSRYEADPTYTPEQVRELRRRWLWNSHRGRADIVLVAEIDGRPGAYATCVLDAGTRTGGIELVGTLPRFRGRGAAGHVVAHALAWLAARADTAIVHTQAGNTTAVRVYERAGFTLHSCQMTYRISLGEAAR